MDLGASNSTERPLSKLPEMFATNLVLPVVIFLLLDIDVASFNVHHAHTPKRLSNRSQHQSLLKTNSLATATRDTTSLHATPIDLLVTMYKDSILDHPIATNMATGGVLAFLGDAIAQSSQNDEYDEVRAASLVSFDIVYRATQCALFPVITDVCDGSHLATPLSILASDIDIHSLATMEQTFANQFIVIPFIYYPVFFTLTGYAQGLSQQDIITRAQTTLVPLLKRNWLFWIPVQYFQFGYVDEPLQIPFLCLAGLAWTFILSATAGSAKKYDVNPPQPNEEIETLTPVTKRSNA